MNDATRTRLMARLVRWEERRLALYYVNGVPHIGIGHNLRDRPLSARAVDLIAEDDVNDTERELMAAHPWLEGLADARYGCLLEMAFNLGVAGLGGFHDTLRAVQESRWRDAARAMLESEWAKQVGTRALELADQMKTGVWQ